MSAQPYDRESRDLFELIEQGVLPAVTGRLHSLAALAAAESRLAAYSVLGMLLLIGLCAAAIVIGWGLLVASLLYVVADYSTTVWLLTALGLAIAHLVLAAVCWHYATALGRNLSLPRLRGALGRQRTARETARETARGAPRETGPATTRATARVGARGDAR